LAGLVVVGLVEQKPRTFPAAAVMVELVVLAEAAAVAA
jgi:hypothetical protein